MWPYGSEQEDDPYQQELDDLERQIERERFLPIDVAWLPSFPVEKEKLV